MAAPVISNPPTADTESKSAKKKRAKAAAAAERTESPAPTTTSEAADPNTEAGDHPYIRDIQKTLRNLNKKLVNVSKTESIIAAHPGKSLEDLLAQKIINADQKQQVINKPSLTNQATQLEEQLAQFKKLQGEFRTKAQTDRAEFEKSSTESRDKAIADALKEQEEKLVAQHQKELSDTLLHLSQFLRLAASRRAEDCDHSLDENLAIEGVLLGVYTGDKAAVDCILKLTRGTNDTTVSVSNEPCQTTFAQLKEIAIEFNKPLVSDVEPEVAENPATDPTVANATLTEIRAGDDAALSNGHIETEAVETPANAEVANTSNAAGEKWDTGNDLSASGTSQDWVNVPRDPAETETGLEATPAAASNTQSWADEATENEPEAAAPVDPNDGFQSVPGRRGRDNRGNNFRGNRGNRGNFRGDGRGRGRGGNRGGAPRGGAPRRQEA